MTLSNLVVSDELLNMFLSDRTDLIIIYSEELSLAQWLASNYERTEIEDSRIINGNNKTTQSEYMHNTNRFLMNLPMRTVQSIKTIIVVNKGQLPIELRMWVDMFVYKNINDVYEFSRIHPKQLYEKQ